MKKIIFMLAVMFLPVVCLGCEIKCTCEKEELVSKSDNSTYTGTYTWPVISVVLKPFYSDDVTFVSGFTGNITFGDEEIQKRIMNQLAKDGSVCVVLGHAWRYSAVPEGFKECNICDLRKVW